MISDFVVLLAQLGFAGAGWLRCTDAKVGAVGTSGIGHLWPIVGMDVGPLKDWNPDKSHLTCFT